MTPFGIAFRSTFRVLTEARLSSTVLARSTRSIRLSSAWPSQPLFRERTIPRQQCLRSFRSSRRNYSSKQSRDPDPHPTSNLGNPEPHSLSARLKKLSREYGYTVIGVYLALTALDFPFCLLAVKAFGTERIAHYEHIVLEGAKNIIRIPFPNSFSKEIENEADVAVEEVREEQAEVEKGEATIWTQLALAFVIHKSFIFIRVPLTAAVTPKVVKKLRSWGYDIGKRKPKTN